MEKPMLNTLKAVTFCLVFFLALNSAFADEIKAEDRPWEKVSFKFGGFLANTNTSLRNLKHYEISK